MTELAIADRLDRLWDHLGLAAAHVATQLPGEFAEFASRDPARLAGMVFLAPTRLDGDAFRALDDRTLAIGGDAGLVTRMIEGAANVLPAMERLTIPGYEPTGWSDVVADHPETISDRLIAFLGRHAASAPLGGVAREGEVAGLRYRIEGGGPALVLPPIFLAPSQWDPALPRLREYFSLVLLGGAHLAGVALLEDRAAAPTYRAMFRTLVDLLDPAEEAHILDVGCGAGSLDRQLATYRANLRITATDLNPFLLREAGALTEAAGLADRISFGEGNATALPFDDDSFDHAFSITVLEECDAAAALAELVRVVRPGGRVGVVVRATDMPQWWHVELPAPLTEKLILPPQSVGATGIADRRLYDAMRRAGLSDLTCFPTLITLDNPGGPIWRYREDEARAKMDDAERAAWAKGRAAALADDLLFMAHPLHAAVGRKPG